MLDREQLRLVRLVIGVLDRFGICYAIGGSVASTVLGVPRLTHDADIAVDPFPGREREFAACFDEDCYLSVQAIQEANRLRRPFNIIHSESGFKVDVFVRKDRPFEVAAMARRRLVPMPDAPEPPLEVLSPEDVILFKLEWFQLGAGVSDRQWTDVLGVLRTQAGRLDEDYLRQTSAELRVRDLLEKALSEAY